MITPVILAGGSGTRLWPLSTNEKPKQLLRLFGGDTLLQDTLARVKGDAFGHPMLVADPSTAASLRGDVGSEAILIVEPARRNTAAAVALAALVAPPGRPILVMPSDHRIADLGQFLEAIVIARAAAGDGKLVTFGVQPTRPETGYGYIEVGASFRGGAFQVNRFVEKPKADLARTLVSDGHHLWNAGIFMFLPEVMTAQMALYAPDVLEAASLAVAGGTWSKNAFNPEPAAFAKCPSISLDYAILEKSREVVVVPTQMDWSDVGSWDAIYEAGEPDEEANVSAGNVIISESRRSLIRADGLPVVAIGVDDLVIVATKEGVLISRRGMTQQVSAVVAAANNSIRSVSK